MTPPRTPPEMQPTSRAGEVIAGRYILLGLLGRGAMGEVFLADDQMLNRYVALKRVASHLVDDADVTRMVAREAQALARLRHPGVVQMYDALLDDHGATVLILEYVPGTSLDRRAEGQIPWDECARIGIAVCEALSAAHSEGVIHRDIKPSNILMEPDGRVRVADFGIARFLDATASATGVIGTPGYIAPEIVLGESSPSISSDLYSLAAVLYELACGRPPFVADNASPAAVLLMHVRDDPPDPQSIAPLLPSAAGAILRRGLLKDPSGRFASAEGFGAALAASAATTRAVVNPGRPNLEDTETGATRWHVSPGMIPVSPIEQTRVGPGSESSGSHKRGISKALVIGVVVVVLGIGAGIAIVVGRSGGTASASRADTTASAAAPASGAKTWSAAPAMSIDANATYTAAMQTSMGDITIALDPKQAPATVNNFVFLSKQGFYNGLTFHRVIPGFMIQGGDPTGTGSGGPGYSFPDELPTAGQYKIGSVAMANAGPDTNGSQFFIVTGADGVSLPPSYSLFGQVTGGQSIANAISNVPRDAADKPKSPVTITSVSISGFTSTG